MIFEIDVEKRLVRKVKEIGGIAFKFTSPGVRAVPDRLVLYKGLNVFVELKAPHRKLRADQSQMGARMVNKGAAVLMINSFEKVDWLIEVLKYHAEPFIGETTPQSINNRFLVDFNDDSLYQRWMKGADVFRGSNLT